MCWAVERGLGREPCERLGDIELIPDVACEREAVEEPASRGLAAAARQVQPRIVDERLDEPAVVAELAAQLDRLAESPLGAIEAPVHDVVEALLAERAGDAIRVPGLAVESASASSASSAARCQSPARSHAPAVASTASASGPGAPTPRAVATAASHSSVADGSAISTARRPSVVSAAASSSWSSSTRACASACSSGASASAKRACESASCPSQ